MAMPCSYEAGTYKEWLVTGDAGPGFGPYRCVFTDETKLRDFLRPGTAFAANVNNVVVRERTVIVAEWQEWHA
jgi:hypothetical protein